MTVPLPGIGGRECTEFPDKAPCPGEGLIRDLKVPAAEARSTSVLSVRPAIKSMRYQKIFL